MLCPIFKARSEVKDMRRLIQRIRTAWRKWRGHSFDYMNPTTDSEARLVVFLLESPEVIMLPEGATFHFVLDEELTWLPKTMMGSVEGGDPLPEEAEGHLFVSFRFWRSHGPVGLPVPSDALWNVLRRIMPSDKHQADSIGTVGIESRDDLRRLQESVSESEAVEAESDAELEHDVTIVEAVTILLPAQRDQSPVVEALQRCMDSLAEFSRIYRLSERLQMQAVTYERLLPASVVWTTRKLLDETGAAWDDGLQLLMFPFRMPGRTQHDELDEERMNRFTSYFERYRGGHPLVAYSERRLEARIAFETSGDYINCVIQVQTALEVLFDGLLSLLLWEEKFSPSDAAKEIFSLSLRKRVSSHFPPRLGGDWSMKGNGAVAQWSQVVVPLRNRVVHAGHRCTRDEAIIAQVTMTSVHEFVSERLADRRNNYMRTTLMFLGQPGLEQFGVWSGKIKRFSERADEEPRWDHSFQRWQEQMLATKQKLSSAN